MRLTLLAAAISSTLLITACSNETETTQTSEGSGDMPVTEMAATNVLMAKSPLQYQAPEFDKITTDMYEPAYEAGMARHMDEIKAIASNPDAPTFENTIVAMEKSGELLNRVDSAFSNLSGLISNAEYQRIEAEISPKLSSHQDDIVLNPELFARIKTIYDNRDSLAPEEKRIAELTYTDFVRAGANLSADEQARIREINTEVTSLQTEFSQNVLNAFKNDTILVEDKAQLAGLSDDEIASLKSAAEAAGKTGYMITLVNTTRQPVLGSLENRELRKKVWEASAYRLQDANSPIVKKLVSLRAEKAALLGYKDWGSYVIADQMAGDPSEVYGILDDLAPKAVMAAKKEAAEINEMIKAEGGDFEVQPWDWAYYSAKVKQAKYFFDESEIKPYFEMNRVLNDGMFYAMNKLYGITVTPRDDLPVWDENVMAWEVFNEDGSSVGLFYLDPYARDGKRGGAWMSAWVSQNGLEGTKPVIYNALNIPKPAEGQPTLMTYDEVSTLFHEFGHAVHGLFSQTKYPSVAGTSVPRDFVEFPSQFHEDYSLDPDVLANYARHYKTGEPIPQDLLAKMLKANKFNSGYNTTEYLAAALLDMEWHSVPEGTEISDVAAFEKQALEKHGIEYGPVPPRYKSTYFSHIFAGGYSAGYYAYLWTEVLAADSFAYLQTQGGITRKNGDLYRDLILSVGNSKDLMAQYVELRGQKPTTDALLKRRGLMQK